MPVEIRRQMHNDTKIILSDVVRRYKQAEEEWQEWAAEWHLSHENLIETFQFNYLIGLFKQRLADTRTVPETVILSLKDTIEGRQRAKNMYRENGILDTGNHDHPIGRLEEIYHLATSYQSASRSGSVDSKASVAANDLESVSVNLQRVTIATPENDASTVSALPGLLMDEIIKCLADVEERWSNFFAPRHPETLVSAALETCAADDCIRSLTYDVDLLFTKDEQDEFARLAQCFEGKWARQWSVKRVHGVAEPMKESSYRKKEKNKKRHENIRDASHGSGSKGKRKKGRQDTKRHPGLSRPSSVIEPPLELTEALSHRVLSAAVFVPVPNRLKHHDTSSKLDGFRNAMTIRLWDLAAANIADDCAEERAPVCSEQTAFRIGSMRHAYARSYQIWSANKSIRDITLQRFCPEPSLDRIDHAIQSCHDRFEQWPNLTLNPWLLGYLIAVHHGTSELSFRRFVATNYTSFFGFLALQFRSLPEGKERYPCLYEFTRTGRIGGEPSLLCALFGQGRYQRAGYKPSTNIRTLGAEFLKEIGSASLIERQRVDWWVELAASRSLLDRKLDFSLDYFAIFEKHCRQREEIFAVPHLRFGCPLDPADDVQMLPAPAPDRIYQRQWSQELLGQPRVDYERFFKDHSEESLMRLAGIPLGHPLEIVEHRLRAAKCPLVNGYCLEFVVYGIRIGYHGFAYTLGEPPRVGSDFQSLRTATYGASSTKHGAAPSIGIFRQSQKFVQGAIEFLQRDRSAGPKKELVALDASFAHDEVQSHLGFVSYPGALAERPSRFLLAFRSMDAVLEISYENWYQVLHT